MHKLDTSFKQAKIAAKTKRRAQILRRAVASLATLAACGGGFFFYYTYDQWSIELLEEELIPVEASIDPELAAPVPEEVYVPTVVHLAGDPLEISIGDAAGPASKVKKLDRPETLTANVPTERMHYLSDTMVSSSQRFMTTLPSSQEDFVFFQSQRSLASRPSDAARIDVSQIASQPTPENLDDEGAGWGEALEGQEEALPEFEKTAVENNTSVALIRAEGQRYRPTEDIFVRVLTPRSVGSLLLENRFLQEEAEKAGERVKAEFELEELQPGTIVAMRGVRDGPGQLRMKIGQMSFYKDDTYLGTVVRTDDGTLTAGADPWVRDDLFSYTGKDDTVQEDRKYRLLDAIYSTAVRNSVPTGIVGEAIMLLSRANDLNQFAQTDDRLVLLYSEEGRIADTEAGKVLYAGIAGSSRSIDCFVFQATEGDAFSCVSEDGQDEEVTVVNGMVTPVNGVKTSGFGPRRHPILKEVRMHSGVDWAAPTGTPVYAAFDGEVSYAGDGGGYGNLVKIKHDAGRETRYAHLDKFSKKAAPGTPVKAGEVIGFVGTTGRSTGPHLHFELRIGERAIDPLQQVIAGVSTGGRAIDTFIDAIIRIESAGNPRAKNPLSTATGLGQFINSTWMRMIRTYRPDLLSMPRQQILDLRFDPTISRAMLYHLTRETESFLRARGHGVTPGRLYLGHFLGPGDANKILRSPPGAPLVTVLSSGVMSANPFLHRIGTVAGIQNWAERKMAGRKGRRRLAAAKQTIEKLVVRRANKKFIAYRDAVQAVLKEQVPVL